MSSDHTGFSLSPAHAHFYLRPFSIPIFWRRLTPPQGLTGPAQKRDWQLVLNSADIDFRLWKSGPAEHIYIPPMLEARARKELASYDCENQRALNARGHLSWPVYSHGQWAAMGVLPMLAWYGFMAGWWSAPDFLPRPDIWENAGSLDAIRINIYGEWYRLVTSLTLHANSPHLFGNLLFGSIFLALLGRLCGWGMALLLTALGGVLGNALSVLLQGPNYASIGFSTALFAAVGALGALMAMRGNRAIFVSLAAAVALLAMLGSEGQTTDFTAHICGLASGFGLGLACGSYMRRLKPPQLAAGALALALPVLAWWLAFS